MVDVQERECRKTFASGKKSCRNLETNLQNALEDASDQYIELTPVSIWLILSRLILAELCVAFPLPAFHRLRLRVSNHSLGTVSE